MRKLLVLTCTAALVLGAAGVTQSASTIYGVSGLIETPDDSVAQANSLALTGKIIPDFNGNKITSYGGAFGLMPRLEVGGVAIDSDAPGLKTEGVFNAKFSVTDESVERPSITVGVVDVSKALEKMDPGIDKASMFVVFGRNLSSMAEGVSGRVSKPVRGTVGFGTGLFNGAFVGLSISAAPKLDLMVEYLSKGIRQESTVNAGLRLVPFGGLSAEVGTIGFDGFYGGLNYTVSTY